MALNLFPLVSRLLREIHCFQLYLQLFLLDYAETHCNQKATGLIADFKQTL
jgi:hypothetical protein